MPFVLLVLAGLWGFDNPYLVEAFNDTLIGGEITPHFHFPEAIYLINDEGARCSGTVIGPNVILTAAHCVSGSGFVRNYFNRPEDVKFQAFCERTGQYASGSEDLDFALCKGTTGKIVGTHPATLARTGPKDGDQVLLTGYGCTIPGGGGGNNGDFKTGKAEVYMLPGGTYDWFVAMAKDAALCFGDSGGGAYRDMDPLKDRHLVIGVNSRGNIRDMSMLTATYLQKSQKFIKSWAKRKKVKICGVNMKCKVAALTLPFNDTMAGSEDDLQDALNDNDEGDD